MCAGEGASSLSRVVPPECRAEAGHQNAAGSAFVQRCAGVRNSQQWEYLQGAEVVRGAGTCSAFCVPAAYDISFIYK